MTPTEQEGGKQMTNYNERLDKALERLAVAGRGWGVSESAQIESMRSELDEAKQAITSLFKELVAEAKPKDYVDYYANDPIERGRKISYDEAVREFEQNLLKALEEV